jgi:hypothetical protein
LFGIPTVLTSSSIIPRVAAGDLFEKSLVVRNLGFEPLDGAPLVMLATVYRDLHIGLPAFPALRVESSVSEGLIQPILQLADPMSEAVLDWNMVGFHV